MERKGISGIVHFLLINWAIVRSGEKRTGEMKKRKMRKKGIIASRKEVEAT